MKITEKILSDDDKKQLKEFDEVFQVLVNKKDDSKQAIIINPNVSEPILLLCASRLNRVLAKEIGMPYETFLKILKNSYSFDEKYGNLDLSDEQLEKIIEKETRKPFY